MYFKQAVNAELEKRRKMNKKFEASLQTLHQLSFFWSVIARALENGGLEDVAEVDRNGEISSTPLKDKEKDEVIEKEEDPEEEAKLSKKGKKGKQKPQKKADSENDEKALDNGEAKEEEPAE